MFIAFELNELFLIFRDLIDVALNDYIEKSITAFTFSTKNVGPSDNSSPFKCEQIETVENYRNLIELGFSLEDETNDYNKWKYLKQPFSPRTSLILCIFSKFAKMMLLFKKNIKKDFNFEIHPAILSKYTDHGVQFITSICIKEITDLLSTQKFTPQETLILIRYNIYQLEKYALKHFIDDCLSYEKQFLENMVTAKNFIYEQLITGVNSDIESYLNNFVAQNFKKKNPVKKSPELFYKLVMPLVVG